MRSGDRDGEVVQRDEGFWFYSAGRRRQGRVCPYLGGGKGRLHRLARRREGELRRRPEPWQGIGRKFEDPLSGDSVRPVNHGAATQKTGVDSLRTLARYLTAPEPNPHQRPSRTRQSTSRGSG